MNSQHGDATVLIAEDKKTCLTIWISLYHCESVIMDKVLWDRLSTQTFIFILCAHAEWPQKDNCLQEYYTIPNAIEIMERT